MSFAETLGQYIPCHPSGVIPWDEVEALFAATCFTRMKTTRQNPVFHEEGDVLTYTRMICRGDSCQSETMFIQHPDNILLLSGQRS